MDENDKLSKKTKTRISKFEEEKEKLINNGYKTTTITIGALKANILSIVCLIPFLILFVGLFLLMGNKIDFSFLSAKNNGIIFIAAIVLGVIIHEIIHGITFSLFTPHGFKDVELGFMISSFTPYAYCKMPLKKHQIILGYIMPFLILGVIPCVIALIKASFIILLYGIIMIAFAGGDLSIIYLISKYKSNSKDKLFYDHPTDSGCIIFEK